MKRTVKLAALMLAAVVTATGCAGSSDNACFVTYNERFEGNYYYEELLDGIKASYEKNGDSKTSYVENLETEKFADNLSLAARSNGIVWTSASNNLSAVLSAAEANPDTIFAVIDAQMDVIPANVLTVDFSVEEGAFLAGFIAAKTTNSKKVGFVGGRAEPVIERFKSGFIAGVKYANTDVSVTSEFCDSYADAEKGKSIALKMYNDGIDVIFQAAGASGEGVIAGAAEAGKWVIGVDRDQSSLAPANVLTSIVKEGNVAAKSITQSFLKGESVGGKEYKFGLATGAVGLSATHDNMSDELFDETMDLRNDIVLGKLSVSALITQYT